MKRYGTIILMFSIALAPGAALGARTDMSTQQVGTMGYVEGSVTIAGKTVDAKNMDHVVAEERQPLATSNGHAEMLLTPGVYLRLGEHSRVRMLSNRLTDTQVAIEQGSAILEVDSLRKENDLEFRDGQGEVRILKTGLYRFDAEPPRVEVYNGKLEAQLNGTTKTAGKHKEVSLSDNLVTQSFKPPKQGDELDRWSTLRSSYESEASVASAQYVSDMGWGAWGGDWFWNPWWSTYTWFPGDGWFMNPYGFYYLSPPVVYDYVPHRLYSGPGGGTTHVTHPRTGSPGLRSGTMRGFSRTPGNLRFNGAPRMSMGSPGRISRMPMSMPHMSMPAARGRR